ncbi:DUF1566 domain-containing protein [Photobacterium kasasachensis]|uniref:Lcl C-terminal domain-containing protein n=1 Tax=Photobacterium kasasachensis TaxID=2910240 RepID=UPI003D0B492F
MKKVFLLAFAISSLFSGMTTSFASTEPSLSIASSLSYPIVDTNSSQCFGLINKRKSCPTANSKTFGQDAQYQGFAPSYTNNHDGTVSDNVTRLMWAQSTDINKDGKISYIDKMTYSEAISYARQARIGGYTDWRIPTIKELYSLILFDGQDPSGVKSASGAVSMVPFIDASVFGFASGDTNAGERLIDSQYVSSTKYVSTTMNGEDTVFGVNFIDGRIKGYGTRTPRGDKTFYVLLVRGNTNYGTNHFTDNNNGTVSDSATGLTWQKSDSRNAMNWPSALAYCEQLNLAGHGNWRLPNAKELQSLVDYTRSPDTSRSAAINSIFSTSPIVSEAGQTDYANYWSSTTHTNARGKGNGVYIAFGRSMGYMHGRWLDVHGAGAQRSDPKTGDANQYPQGKGPQGDAIRIDNYVRCVTSDDTKFVQQPNSTQRMPVTYALSDNETPTNMQRGKPEKRQHRQPPKAAIAACASKTIRDDCQMNTPHGLMNGQCQSIEQTKACVPTKRPI